MDYSLRIIDRTQLSGFINYLTSTTVSHIVNADEDVFAIGAVTDRSSCGALAVRLNEETAEITDIFVDEQIRNHGVGTFLIESMLGILEGMGVSFVRVNYVMSEEHASYFGKIITKSGFLAPTERSRVYRVKASAFADAGASDERFVNLHRDEYEIKSFAEISQTMIDKLTDDSEMQGILSWKELSSTADREISAALIRDGRIEEYFLCAQNGSDFVILAANSRSTSLAGDFYYLALESLKYFENRYGSPDFNVCFSALGSMVKRIVRKFPQEKVTSFVEMSSEITL